MERRAFLRMIGGVTAGAAVRTFPFRVYSFPSAIELPTSKVHIGTFSEFGGFGGFDFDSTEYDIYVVSRPYDQYLFAEPRAHV